MSDLTERFETWAFNRGHNIQKGHDGAYVSLATAELFAAFQEAHYQAPFDEYNAMRILARHQVMSCSCLTKTGEHAFHDRTCKYRKLAEAIEILHDYVRNKRNPEEELRLHIEQEVQKLIGTPPDPSYLRRLDE